MTSILAKLACAAALGSFLSGCAGEDTAPPREDIATSTQAFTQTQPTTRPDITDLTAAQRVTLRDAILDFITQPILDEHANAHDWHHPAVGELFFIRHHDYLNKLESYLLGRGLTQFVPVPEWNPGDDIPAEFMVVDPLVSGFGTMNSEPDQVPPARFADDRLCAFATPSDLARDVEGWHNGVHSAVGGAMGSLSAAPGAPIFWLWHGFLDDMYHEYNYRCRTVPAVLAILN